MDFTNVINAIDRLVKNRVGAAAYTRMFIAVVQGVEDTETNTYKISYDGGKTSVTAITIAPDINETIYKKGDSVQVLQLNGDGNTNLYILGKNSDITQKNIDELDSHFIIKNTHKVGDTLEFRLNVGGNAVETIKSFGSFIIGATFSVDNSKEVYNYGIKITLSFGQKGTITYIFDTYQMLGQPWNYKNIRQEFKQKIDEFYCPYLETITLEKFAAAGHESQTEIKDIEISSALLHEANVYTAEFKGSKTGLDFITEKQAGKNNTTLQVLFYKNDIFFASEKCKYYWFRRDESVDSENEHYHRYGGKGWYLLNSIETQTSIDGDKEIPETIVKNNIGNSLQISNEIANQYHNYFKCVVEYGMYTAATEEKEILNLDSTALSFSLTTDSNVITKLDENTILNIKLDLNDSSNQVNLIKWSYQKDNTGSREYIITAGAEKELNLANAASTEAVRKISNILGLQHTTFYCTLINTSVNPIVTLGEAKLTITRDLSTELIEEIWYYDNGDSIVPPTTGNITNWTTDLSKLGDVSSKYIFAASRMVSPTYEGPFGDIYCYSAHGTGAAAAQLTEFNRLTHNGKDQGLYYAKDDTNNKLYINADYINTGTLRVGNRDNEKFYASIGDKKVKIGGFTVSETDLKWGPDLTDLSKGYVYLGQNGLQLGPSFKIDPQGNIDWNANNSPIRQKYSEGNTWPIDTSWHDSKQDNDKYYAQSSDGGDTWAGPFLIQGEKGEDGTTITSIINYYLATTDQIKPSVNGVTWEESINSTSFNETNKYLWTKQVTSFNNKDPENLIYLIAVYGQKGNDGTSVNIKENKEACTNIGDAYINADGNLQVLTKLEGNDKIFTNAGQIKGPAGTDGTGINLERKYLLTAENKTIPDASENWLENKPPLTTTEPFLWCKDRYYRIDKDGQDKGNISILIYLLESLPVQTYVKYVNMNELKFNADGTDIESTGSTVNMKDVPDANSGWMGTYSGYSQSAPTNYKEYKWTYYLAEINRTNFMEKVIDNAKDTNGNYIDGIYTEENTTTGKKYIGINASAINTGSLKVTDGTNTIFNANISDKKVNIGGWYVYPQNISDDWGQIGLYSGMGQESSSLVTNDEKASVRFFAAPSIAKNTITNLTFGTKNWESEISLSIAVSEINDRSRYYEITLSSSVLGPYNSNIYPEMAINGATVFLTRVESEEAIEATNFTFYISANNSLYISRNALLTESKFRILEDGSLYASAASIKGNINATSGNIGNWSISNSINNGLRGEVVSGTGNNVYRIDMKPDADASHVFSIYNYKSEYGDKRPDKNTFFTGDGSLSFYSYYRDSDNPDAPTLSGLTLNTVPKGANTNGYGRIETEQGDFYIKAANGYSGFLNGTWYGSFTTPSSRNKKYDIEELDNRYSTLLDNLKPVRFKYNDGVSNRYHTGLILDEMKDAMDTAQIDSSEFAAYCVQDEKTGDGGIRYEELIALLIKEVQSLKTQVNVLTEKLNKLEEK